MKFIDQIDRVTLETLEATGATKWAFGDGSIGAFVAEMDFGISPPIKRALRAAVNKGCFGYLPAGLISDLGMATSDMLRQRYGWDVPPADVYPVPDVLKALEMAIEHHSRPASKIIVPTPSYTPFLIVPPMLGRDVIEVPMKMSSGVYALDLEGIERAFENGGNLLILCNPHNPAGRTFRRDELIAIGDLVARQGGRVFADEIWAPLVYTGGTHIPYASISAATAEHTITAISASKAWNLPGLKCAQVITSNDGDRAIWKEQAFLAAHGTSNLGAVANAAAYRSGFPWLADVLTYLDRNRQALASFVAERLPGVSYHVPEGTYVGWLDFSNTPLKTQPAAFFKQYANVRLTEGHNCGKDFASFARFIFAMPLPIMDIATKRMSIAFSSISEGDSR